MLRSRVIKIKTVDVIKLIQPSFIDVCIDFRNSVLNIDVEGSGLLSQLVRLLVAIGPVWNDAAFNSKQNIKCFYSETK